MKTCYILALVHSDEPAPLPILVFELEFDALDELQRRRSNEHVSEALTLLNAEYVVFPVGYRSKAAAT
jgi:hypothetical protein